MFSIRNNVFETNSSSSHSICINKNVNELNTDISNMLDEDGVWNIDFEDISFGRSPFRVLTAFYQKVLYAIASLYNESLGHLQDINNIVKKHIPNFKKFRFNDAGYYYTVDENILSAFLRENNVSLEDFITNKRYIVICDGDEYNIFSHVVDCGIVGDNITIY